MSYSFNVRAATKDEVRKNVGAEMDKVVASQPVHAADAKLAHDTVSSFIDLLRDDDTQDISVSVHGSCGGVEAGLNSVSIGVTAALDPRK